MLIAGCAGASWNSDPEVQNAEHACSHLPLEEQYACIEGEALRLLDPEICRLAGMAIDALCL